MLLAVEAGAVKEGSGFLSSSGVLGRAITACAIRPCAIKLFAIKVSAGKAPGPHLNSCQEARSLHPPSKHLFLFNSML
jgi:hypothetical protein